MKKVVIWPNTGQFNVDANPLYQDWLRNDHPREYAYRRAIQTLAWQLPHANRILDAGTGTGVWGIAATALFPHAIVDLIDSQQENVDRAHTNAVAFPTLRRRIRFGVEDFTRQESTRRYDIIITELDGGVGGNEGAKLVFARLAKRLSPGGVFLPNSIKVYVAPTSLGFNDTVIESPPFLRAPAVFGEDPYALYYYAYGAERSDLIAPPQLLDSIIPKKGMVEILKRRLSFRVRKSSNFSGFLVWFNHEIVPGVRLTNAPGKPVTSWGQSYFPTPLIAVSKGDSIEVAFAEHYRTGCSLPYYTWKTSKNGRLIADQSNETNQLRRR